MLLEVISMTIKEKIKVRKVIRNLAQRDGISSEEVLQKIQESIDAAWDNQDPAVRWKQLQLFPAGKPTSEEFIVRVAREI